jgi:subtilisin family serine protease
MKKWLVCGIVFLVLSFFLVSAVDLNSSPNNPVKVFIKFKQDNSHLRMQEVSNVKQTLEAKLNVKHDFGDLISVVVSQEELEELKQNPNIESITPVNVRNIFLEASVPLINTTSVWSSQINNINLTGQGQTVCIIDTGVDYNHTDLGNCYGYNNLSNNCKIIGGIDYCADDITCTTSDSDPKDVHGHGTHVAGIVAANGGKIGVAPDANLVIIKAANSTGALWDDDIKAGIDWCVDNYQEFNISVISMSLGGGAYTSYCDGVDDPSDVTSSLNNAISKNISVVVATGNNGVSTYIAWPACMVNSTRVSSTTKTDVISSFANRDDFFTDILLAPGGASSGPGSCPDANRICSLNLGGGYISRSGTSMSTPHVSGAIAILKQFQKLQSNSALTPAQAETILQTTGKSIYDSATGLSFSRIDIYSAILSMDETPPIVTLTYPLNLTTMAINISTSFNCTATDGFQMKNLTFYLWNSTSSLLNQSSISSSNSALSLNTSLNLSSGTYYWNCEAFDSQNNSAFYSNNYTLFVGNVVSSLDSPSDNSFSNLNETNFTCGSSIGNGNFLSNVSFYLWNSTSDLIYNFTKNISGISNSSVFNYSLDEEDYFWNCLTLDNSSNSAWAENNFSFGIDLTNPNVTLISPSNSSTYSGTQIISFKYNVSEDNLANCSLYLNNTLILFNSSINTSITNSFNYSLSASSYNWSIHCFDKATNAFNSSIRTLTLSVATVSTVDDGDTGGGSSGGGGGTTSYAISESDLAKGVTRNLLKGQSLGFYLKNIKHTLTVNGVFENTLALTIQSEPINIVLVVNQTQKVDLDNDKIYDLSLIYRGALYSRAFFEMISISEPIPVKEIFDAENKSQEISESGELTEEPEEKSDLWKIFLAIILLGILVFLILKYIKFIKSRKQNL